MRRSRSAVLWPRRRGYTLTELTDLAAWFDASDAASITQTGGLVSQWNDKSGNARHATNTGSNRPTTGSATINGLNCISTSPTSWLQVAAPGANLTNDMALYIVFRKTGANNSFESAPVNLSASNQGQPFDRFSNTSFGHLWNIVGAAGDSYTDLRTVTSAAQMSWIGEKDGAGAGTHVLVEYLNGTLVRSNNVAGTWNGGGFLMIGRRADGVVLFTGDIGEVLVYNAAHNAATREAIESYLKAKWGTP